MSYNVNISDSFAIQQETYDATAVGFSRIFSLISAAVDNIPTTTSTVDAYWDFSAAKTWDTGDVNYVINFNLNSGGLFFDGASIVSDASCVYLGGPPLARTNATITNAQTMKFSAAYTTASGETSQIRLYPLQIEDGIGSITSLFALNSPGDVTISLGDQTADLTNLAVINLEACSFESTTNTRTVTNAYTLRIGGPPTNIGNVTFTNPAESLRVDTGITHFKGRTNLGKGADISSANDLTLGDDGNLFKITGTTTINAITTENWFEGAIVILYFTGTLTLSHNVAGGGGTAVMYLPSSTDWITGNGTVLTLIYDGAIWRTISLTSPY